MRFHLNLQGRTANTEKIAEKLSDQLGSVVEEGNKLSSSLTTGQTQIIELIRNLHAAPLVELATVNVHCGFLPCFLMVD